VNSTGIPFKNIYLPVKYLIEMKIEGKNERQPLRQNTAQQQPIITIYGHALSLYAQRH
jgi:hypothetical protein